MRVIKIFIGFFIITFFICSCQSSEGEIPPILVNDNIEMKDKEITTMSEIFTTTVTTTIPVATTTPVETTTPVATTTPVETTTPVATTTPVETTTPSKTTTPTETTFSETTTTPILITPPPPLSPLSSNADLKLREDFASYKSDLWYQVTTDDIIILYYFGTYNDCEVVVMWGNDYDMTTDMKEIEVAGYTFYFGSGSLNLMLHKDSSFIDIRDAYEQGYLNDNDIYKIHYYVNQQSAIII